MLRISITHSKVKIALISIYPVIPLVRTRAGYGTIRADSKPSEDVLPSGT